VTRIGVGGPLVVVGLFAAPVFLDLYTVHVAVLVLLFAIVAIGLSLVMGFAGQISLAQAAFFGVGAYAAAILTVRLHWNPWAAAPVGVLAAVASAFVCALPALRVQSHYLGIVSLGLAIAFASLLTNSAFTGGAEGIVGIPPLNVAGIDMTDEYNFFYLALVVLLALGAFGLFVARTTLGRRFRAMRDDTLAAAACGIEIRWYRLVAFLLAGLFAGVAGVLYAHFARYVSPDSFSLNVMFLLLAMVIIGGRDSVWGSATGALLLIVANNLLTGIQAYQELAYGALVVACVIFAPQGLAGTANAVASRLGARARRWTSVPLPLPRGRVRLVSANGRRDGPRLAPAALTVNELSKRFRGVQALAGVSLEVRAGEIHGIIGPNGSGKTTLFNVVSGIERLTAGSVRLSGRDVGGLPAHRLSRLGVARTFQNPRLFRHLSVLENVMVALDRDPVRRHVRYLLAPWKVWRRERGWRLQAIEVLRQAGLEDAAGEGALNLPYGRQRQLEIARAMAAGPSLLLLDEPAAGLNAAETDVLQATIRRIREAGVTVVVIEHDMRLVMTLCERITALAHGRVLATGTPAEVSRDPAVVEAYLGTEVVA
jgi:branched-chain amino acid transport system permease protein